MLDFVPNHMAMDNDYLPHHPEYFVHEKISLSQEELETNYDFFEPKNWPRHENGKAQFRLWHSKGFGESGDHFFVQEVDANGAPVGDEVFKFYHGKERNPIDENDSVSWRDTVQVNYQSPSTQEFMLKNYLKVVHLTRGGGVRWDFVHNILQHKLKEHWHPESTWEEFLLQWSGIHPSERKTEAKWKKLLLSFLKERKAEELSSLQQVQEQFRFFLNEKGEGNYPNLAFAFHYEGLGEIIRSQLFPKMKKRDYVEMHQAIEELTFKQPIQEYIVRGKRDFPKTVNIAEAYHDERYLLDLGFDAIYASHIYDRLVKWQLSLEESVEGFFEYVKRLDPFFLERLVLYLLNHDEQPPQHVMSIEELKIKASLLYGLPGVKFTEWGLLNGNTRQLGATTLTIAPDTDFAEKFNPYLIELTRLASNDIIETGQTQFLNLAGPVYGYSREKDGNLIIILVNTSQASENVSIEELNLGSLKKPKMLFRTDEDKEIFSQQLTSGRILLAPYSSVWLQATTQPQEKDQLFFELYEAA